MRFHFTIHHVPGKTLYTANTLSRAPLQNSTQAEITTSTEVEHFVDAIRAVLPASTDHLKAYAQAQANDTS